jgi:hypothetical protein
MDPVASSVMEIIQITLGIQWKLREYVARMSSDRIKKKYFKISVKRKRC